MNEDTRERPVETSLFWLSSRYYSPELCRFISPDSVEYLNPESINGLNLYAYCGNDPINKYDPTGHSAILIGLIIGAVIGFGAAAYIDYQDDGEIFNGSVKWYDYLGATMLGGAIGAGIGYIAPQIGSALSSFASSSFTLGGGISVSASGVATMSAGVTVTGAQILQGAGILAGLGIMYILPKQGGVPNSVVSENGSTGVYDENGNLISRTDTTHSHFIKELGDYFRPHTHKYVWKFIKGAWRIVRKIVLPY